MTLCRYRKENGMCTKFGGSRICKAPLAIAFNDAVCDIEPDEVCKNSSIYGNRYIRLTMENIQHLLEGKVLFRLDEYGTFISLSLEKRQIGGALDD